VPYWNLALRLFSPFGRYKRYVEQTLETSADLPGLAVRSLNTARGAQPRLDWSKGAINLASIRAAAAELGAAPAALRVLVCHHPLVELKNTVVSGGVQRGAAAAGLLADAGVDLILSGHVHNPFAFAIRSPEVRSYAIGAGTLYLAHAGNAAGVLPHRRRRRDDQHDGARLDGREIRADDALGGTAPARRRPVNLCPALSRAAAA
jgi:3',5'-cyclic AMP phosphodiesterase CpdA